MDMEFPTCLENQPSHDQNDVHTNVMEKKSIGSLFSFPKDLAIQGGSTLLWPLWMHIGFPGRISLSLSIYYEMENTSGEMSYRTLHMHCNLELFWKWITSRMLGLVTQKSVYHWAIQEFQGLEVVRVKNFMVFLC